ncbi:MAG: ABC transporter permease/substrate-binding protein [Elusimicrobia bacterium]|nr:ABC transporter permease/substrate-binding protein [Elusimicrobiota bacterium]
MDFVLEHRAELWLRLAEHLGLTAASVGAAALAGLPLGALVRRRPGLEGPVLALAGVLQTVPSLALLSLLIVILSALPALPLLGRISAIGAPPALVALTLYALLPIVRNTVAGLRGVPQASLEAADGLGMTANERLRLVELPLAMPVIVAGIRTAAVAGVGITTLSAFIGAGGLGEFINRGLYLSQHRLILLGALPAAWLALAFDQSLAWVEAALERGPQAAPARRRARRGLAWVAVPALAAGAALALVPADGGKPVLADVPLRAAFTGEFIGRPDCLSSVELAYGMRFSEVRDMEASLMYRALAGGAVDLISAYSTDGRLRAYGVRLLEDDLHVFPAYEAAPVVRQAVLDATPGLAAAWETLAGRLDEEAMRKLNYEVDERKRSPAAVAREFLESRRLYGSAAPKPGGRPVVIGTKAFTEGVLLGELMAQLVESRLGVRVLRRFSLGGTMIVHNALKAGEIDAYAEYTGTALTAILGLPAEADRASAYATVAREYPRRFGCRWLGGLGFSNTYALGVREADAARRGWRTIGDLKRPPPVP